MIDSHAHLISGDTARYPPSPPSGVINDADFEDPMTVERLAGEMDAAGVDKAVLVQRGSIYGFDSSYVCDSAARFPDRFAAVCSIDASQPDAAEQVYYWVRDRGAVGIRLMELVRGSGLGWLDAATGRDACAAARDLGVPVCVHLFPWNRVDGLARLAALLTDLPGLTVVIDHLGAIDCSAAPPDYGVDELMASIARFSGAHVKFTTIPLGRLEQTGIDVKPIIRRVMDLFGASRMMWGSDITQSAGTYAYMTALAHASVAGLSSAEQDSLLGGTAGQLYGRNWSAGLGSPRFPPVSPKVEPR